MNGLVTKRLVVLNLASLLMLLTAKNSPAQIIYGLERASQFHSAHHGPFSISAGTFRSKSSAEQVKNRIAANSRAPVRIVAQGKLYSVLIGPLSSSQQVRNIGNSACINEPIKKRMYPIKRIPKKVLVSVSKRPTPPPKMSLPPVKSFLDNLRATVLLGGSDYSYDEQHFIVFPADAFRTDSFQIHNNTKISFASAVGLSYEKTMENSNASSFNPSYSLSLGLNAYYNENSRDGSVYEYSLPDFNNSTYDLKIKSYRLMLDAEWALRPLFLGVMPFVKGGIGAARNELDFQNLPRPDIGADGGYYHLSHDENTCFAYEVGAGIKLPINAHLQLSAQYLYADAGDAETGVADSKTGVVLASPLRTAVHSQSLLFGLSYLFG